MARRDDVDDPGGHPGLEQQVREQQGRERVSSAGFTTAVHPAASAGAILRVAIASGKFHGVMRNVGPTGLWVTIARPEPSGLVP